ncbi:hypothetical protein B7R22_17150 [Subtercola boreus]|uniref:Ammonia monooxygenase n=1 Tax=Subtercola boreus TaxID=120213 RepID=A0A3E0VRA2_9MICO|nr:hypothetical protein [Subtercola boreus]RFA12231.1 hypothetical protein B7R22_17150 [Subtercola boreus]
MTKHIDDADETPRYHWWCPGCDALHVFDKRWMMTGTLEAPTFDGSYLSRHNRWNPETGEHDIPLGNICHSYVRVGRIEYLGDCTHELVGQTVDMVPLPAGWAD